MFATATAFLKTGWTEEPESSLTSSELKFMMNLREMPWKNLLETILEQNCAFCFS